MFSRSGEKVPNQLVGAPLLTDVTLICNVEASPKAINYWQRENGKIMNWKIFNFSYFFIGADFCAFVSVWIRNHYLHLYWIKNCIIHCFSGPPGEMIITNERYLMTETENSMYAVQMTLVVRKLQKSDMGGYKCISKNSIGDAEGTIRLYGKHPIAAKLWTCYTVDFELISWVSHFSVKIVETNVAGSNDILKFIFICGLFMFLFTWIIDKVNTECPGKQPFSANKLTTN